MKLLLDTHVFIWFDSEPERLTPRVAELVSDSRHQLFLSLASVWEMQIKVQIEKLKLRVDLVKLIDEERFQNQISFLPITIEDILSLSHHPFHHRDPFDRMLIAQAARHDMQLLTDDSAFAMYPIKTIWK